MRFFCPKKLKITQNKQAEGHEERYRRWDKQMAAIFGLLAFFMLVGIVLYNVIKKDTNSDNSDDARSKINRLRERKTSKCTIKKCKVKCEKIDENAGESFKEEIKLCLLNNDSCSVIHLRLSGSTFKNQEINYGWLKNIPVQVKKLKIFDCGLAKLNENAFLGDPFEKSLEHLEFQNTYINSITANSFHGLNVVKTFSFQCHENVTELHISENALEQVRETLEVLEFHRCKLNATDIIKLTGYKASLLIRLYQLDLTMNEIKNISNYSFINAPQLTNLHLSDCGIETIEKHAFAGGSSIMYLNLSNNALKSLPKGTFDTLTGLLADSLILSNNLWKCNCDLKWLKDYYVNNNIINLDYSLTCEEGDFSQVEFCPKTITPSYSVSTITDPMIISKPTTSRHSDDYLQLICQIHAFSPIRNYNNINNGIVHKIEIEMVDRIVILEIYELETEPLLIEIVSNQHYYDVNLIWFHESDKSNYGCITPLRKNQTVYGLTRGTTYKFSLLQTGARQLSPKSNFCLKTAPEWGSRTWISNRYQTTIIASLVCGLLIILLISTYITYICIRRHPRLISSNESVIIVKSKKDSISNQTNKEYERPPCFEPYLIPSSQGYLTPIYHRYSRIKYRPPLNRSISDWSVASLNEGDSFEKLDALRAQTEQMRFFRMCDNYRPPLPPPNSRLKTSQESQNGGDDIYSSV